MWLMIATLQNWARLIKRDVHAVFLASKDPRVPWHAKVLALLVAAYAVSPIDLIPDVIPVLGLLDDMILLPLGIYLVVRLVPPDLMAEFRAQATNASNRPGGRAAAVAIVCLWLLLLVLCCWLVYRLWWAKA